LGGKPTIFGNIHIPGKPTGNTHNKPIFVGTFLASPLWTVPRPVSAVPEDPHVVFQPQHRWVADQMCFGDRIFAVKNLKTYHGNGIPAKINQ